MARGKQQPRLTRREKKAHASSLVEKANKTTDLLSSLQEWTTYKKWGLDLKIESKNSQDLSKEELDRIFDLLKTNMKEMYENSDWGWDEDIKWEELTHQDARFLIARDATEKIVGFSHFRFDLEINHPIIYCYELQIDSEIQRKGLGRHLMNILTLLAFKFNLVKILLTVFTHNAAALSFYRDSLCFGKDETCPYEEEEKCYVILRKSIVKGEVSQIKC